MSLRSRALCPSCALALFLAFGLGFVSSAQADPTVPGFTVEVYANVDDPTRLAFAPDGVLYTGRDALGSGGGAGDAVKIHRIGVGGAPVVEYGVSATPDPDSVAVDVLGLVSNAGSVLVGGFISVPSGGRISEIATDESVSTLFASTAFDNPSDIEFDSTGRMLFTNFANPPTPSGVFQSTGASPTALFTTTPKLGFLDLDANDRIYVSADNGTIQIYDSVGTLVDGSFVSGLSGSAPLAVGSLAGLPTGVFTINSSDELIHKSLTGTTTVVGTDFGGSSDLQFGPDGSLYVARFDEDRVLRIVNPTSQLPALHPLALCALGVVLTAAGRAFVRSQVP